jgi:hypothetical protein
MMDHIYAKFTEHNEWEGETWRFYIPIEGNEAALCELEQLLLLANSDSSYELDMGPFTESAVDTVVKQGNDDCGYMPAHTKLVGLLRLPPELRAAMSDPEDDPLYKGEIREFMQERIEQR